MLVTSHYLLLEKILHLSKRLEKKYTYKLLEPWSFDSHDIIEVQKVSKRISEFIGLSGYSFIISYAKQKTNTAGHIELNKSTDVFIEIDEKFKSDSEIILAILAHEICHKFIDINGLTLHGYENEILTDVATVYTGLGKLSLNGCQKDNGSLTQKIGYLERKQFAFLYNVICNMRRIPKIYSTSGLSPEALKSIEENEYLHYDDLFYNESILHEVNEILGRRFLVVYKVLAENIKLIKTFQLNLKKELEKNKEVHRKIRLINDGFLSKATENHNIESVNYIKNLILTNELNKIDKMYPKEIEEISLVNGLLMDFLQENDKRLILNIKEREILYVIKCPICDNKMRLKQDKLVKVKCTKCKYLFIVDNSMIDKQSDSVEPIDQIQGKSKKRKFLKRFTFLKKKD